MKDKMMEFFKKHWRKIWYYASIVIDIFLVPIFITNSRCIGGGSPDCNNVNWFILTSIFGFAIANTYFARQKYKQAPALAVSQKFSWRSTYALPLSFIIFLTFSGIFLEQLRSVQAVLSGAYNAPGFQYPFIEGKLFGIVWVLAGFGGFGTFLWLLYRWLNWPLVWVILVTVGALAEWFLFGGQENTAIMIANPLGATIFFMTTWSVIFLTPYFLYRSIDRRWGKYGRRIAIVIVVLLNVLTITFFAFEKYVLHHYSSQNFQQVGR